MTTPVQSAALGVINDKLQTGWFNPVTHADIKTVTGRSVSAPERRCTGLFRRQRL